MKVIWCTYIASCDISTQILHWHPRHILLYVFKSIVNHIILGTWLPKNRTCISYLMDATYPHHQCGWKIDDHPQYMYSFFNKYLKSKLLKAWKLIVMDVPFPIHQTCTPSLKFMGDLIKIVALVVSSFQAWHSLVVISEISSFPPPLKFVTCVLLCYIFVLLSCGFTL
jgi:hypothetical protein